MVIIVGGGITGAATAYYLSQQQKHSDVTIIDAVGPATCSKAAAFLSESWGDGTKTEKLHRKSFALHLQLAEELCLESFCHVPVYQGVDLEEDRKDSLDGMAQRSGRHALVDPQELVTKLVDQSGAKVEIHSVSGLQMDECGFTTGIEFETGEIKPLDAEEAIVVAMGPWTCRLEDWIDRPIPMPIDGVLSTSIVWQDLTPFGESPVALFCEEDMRGCQLEIFQRVDRSLYVSGLGNSKPLKASQFRSPNRPLPGQETPSRPNAAIRSLQQNKVVSSDTLPEDVRACIRPMSADGIPIVGKIGNTNLFVASGGGQWGITWGPLLGQIVAHQICSSEPPPLLSALRPRRFDTVVQRALMKRRTIEAWETSDAG